MENNKKIIPSKNKLSTNMFIIFAFVFSVDFLTTTLALNLSKFEGMFVELNPIASYFQSFGLIGYMGNFVFSLILLYLVSLVICKLLTKIKNDDYRKNLYMGMIILYLFIELAIIGNTIWLMITS